MATLVASAKAALVFGLGALLGCGERPRGRRSSWLRRLRPERLERASVRAAYSASRQREAASDPRYAADLKNLTAHNPPSISRRASVSRSRGQPHRRWSDWKLGLSLKGVGCDGRVEAVTTPGKPHVVGAHRVHYEHALAGVPLSEWHEDGALGLEQGFTLQKATCRAAKVVTVVLNVRGLTARSCAAGVELVDGSGQLRLRYTDLFAAGLRWRCLAIPRWWDRQPRAARRASTDAGNSPVRSHSGQHSGLGSSNALISRCRSPA